MNNRYNLIEKMFENIDDRMNRCLGCEAMPGEKHKDGCRWVEIIELCEAAEDKKIEGK